MKNKAFLFFLFAQYVHAALHIQCHWKTGYAWGLYICGFPSGSSGANSQEIVLEYPRGYRAIGFRVEKKTRSPGDGRKREGERDTRRRASARTKNKKTRRQGEGRGKSEVHTLRTGNPRAFNPDTRYIFRFKETRSSPIS